MKERSKRRFLWFCLFCTLSFFIASCSNPSGGGSNSEEDNKSEKTDTPDTPDPSPVKEVTYTVTYKTEKYGVIPDSLKKGISVKENTVLNESQLPTLTDENAVFKGWYDGSTKALAGRYKVTKNVTLTALWGDEATVSYSSVFGNIPTSFTAKLNDELTNEQLSDISCSPYTFLGWYYSEDENGNGSGTQAYTGDKIKSDVTLTAKWKTATIIFETQFGDNSSITKYTGQTITMAELPLLSEAGYDFDGWYDGSTKLEPGEVGYEVTGDKNFTAHWTARHYSVTFDKNANDATGNMNPQDFTFDTAAELSSKAFERTGYTFQGWAVSSDAVTAAYEDKQSFNVPAHDITLYAVWKANEYTITFNSNNNANETTIQKVTFGTTQKLKANAFTYHGYRFAGWNTAENADGTSYSDNADFAVIQAADINLYAQWVETDRYVISYQNTRGATNSSPTSYRASEGATLSDLSLNGYIFDGWYNSKDTNGNGSGEKFTGWAADTKTGDITLYAKWSPRTDTAYKVEHWQENADDDGYTLFATDTSQRGTTDSFTSVTANNYTNFTAQSFEQKKIAPNGSTVVRIDYRRNRVKMSFDLDGGKIGEDTSVIKTGKYGSLVAVGIPLKKGWTFASWSPALPERMEAGNFKATYTANTNTAYKVYHKLQNANDNSYTLKDTENSTGTTAEQTLASPKSYEHFTPENFEQKTIAADGSTEITIKYKREIVTLTLDLAGGTLDGKTGILEKSGKWEQSVIVGVPEREGYVFEGWDTADGTLPATFDSNATYTAQWTAVNVITITVNVSDIEVSRSASGNTITFSAEECDSYNWLLDDEVIGTTQTCAIDTSNLTKGTYTLSLEAEKGGRWYSYYAQIKAGE